MTRLLDCGCDRLLTTEDHSGTTKFDKLVYVSRAGINSAMSLDVKHVFIDGAHLKGPYNGHVSKHGATASVRMASCVRCLCVRALCTCEALTASLVVCACAMCYHVC